MSGKHISKSLNNLLESLEKAGCSLIETKNGIKIHSPDGINTYICHRSESAFHPVRRWANRFVLNKRD